MKLINHKNLGVHHSTDSTKLGNVTLLNVIPMENIEILIIYSEAAPVSIEGLEEKGVRVNIEK